jgi:hypothetical protein
MLKVQHVYNMSDTIQQNGSSGHHNTDTFLVEIQSFYTVQAYVSRIISVI